MLLLQLLHSFWDMVLLKEMFNWTLAIGNGPPGSPTLPVASNGSEGKHLASPACHRALSSRFWLSWPCGIWDGIYEAYPKYTQAQQNQNLIEIDHFQWLKSSLRRKYE